MVQRSYSIKSEDPEIIRPYKKYLMNFDDHDDHGGRHQTVGEAFGTTLKEIFGSHSYELSRLVKCVVGGVIGGLAIGYGSLFMRHNYRTMFEARRLLSAQGWAKRKLKVYTAQGAGAGFGWYVWYWSLLHPHGTYPSFYTNVLGISMYVGLMSALLITPSAFAYGAYFGMTLAIPVNYLQHQEVFPGFEMPISKVSEEAREKAVYEDVLTQLGKSKILNQKNYIIPQ